MSDDEDRSYAIRTRVEDLLAELADVWSPEEATEWAESVAARMREELEELERGDA